MTPTPNPDQTGRESTSPVDFLLSPVEAKNDAKLLDVIRNFLKAHDKLESKYWPLLEIFLERLEKGLQVKRVTGDFHRAYRQAKQLEPKEVIPGYWYRIVNEIRRIALMGRSWIEEHRVKDFGFWKLLELANFELEEPKKKKGRSKGSAIKNKHFKYFLIDCPAEFPFLFTCFTEQERLPDLVKDSKEPAKDFESYEKMCIRLLDRLLSNPLFSFNLEYNWPALCHQILQRIGGAASHSKILDIETTTTLLNPNQTEN